MNLPMCLMQVRINQRRDKVIFKIVESSGDTMWGLDKHCCVWFKEKSSPDLYTNRELEKKLPSTLMILMCL